MPQLQSKLSARARAREALRCIERQYPLLLSKIPDVVWTSDRDGNTTFISPNVENVYGYTPEEIYSGGNELWFGRIHPDDLQRVERAYTSLCSGGDSFDAEYRIQRKDGRWIWIHDRALAVYEQSGVVAFYGLFSDITTRKRAEDLQQNQNRVLELIATGAPLEEALTVLAHAMEERSPGLLCSVLLLDPEGKRLLLGSAPSLPDAYNQAIHGVAIGPSVGSCGTAAYRGERVIVPDIAASPFWKGYCELALRHGLRACWSEPIRSSGGQVLGTFAMYYREPHAPSNEELKLIETAAHLAGIAIEHHRAQDDLRMAKEAAETASQLKSDFLANMSHEIRTPMTAILGYADLLLEPKQSPEDRTSYVQILRQNGTHLLAILNDILDLSKIEAGKLTVERIPCSPSMIVGEVRSLLHARALEKNLDFQIEFVGPIPETIQSDPTRLRQILLNLVGNAIKFTRAGTVLLIVNLLEIPGTGEASICFEVLDTGPGMTPEQKKGLFHVFTQGDASVTRTHGGTGLGLAISKKLAQMLGGDICVQTAAGEGSSFIVTADTGPLEGVNLVAKPNDVLLDPKTVSVTTDASIQLSGRVLLAEDVAVNQRLISFHLNKAGLTVKVAENGRVAIENVLAAAKAGEPFDVIFMDMQMPVLDGFGATTELRNLGYTGPIVALTASAMSTDRERCYLAGCTAFLSKPIDRIKLLETVARFLKLAGK